MWAWVIDPGGRPTRFAGASDGAALASGAVGIEAPAGADDDVMTRAGSGVAVESGASDMAQSPPHLSEHDNGHARTRGPATSVGTSVRSMANANDEPIHRSLGLTDSEYDDIVRIIGRDPNHLELAMYSVM